MCAPRSVITAILPIPAIFLCLGGLLLGGLAGCTPTPDSSGSSAAPDSTAMVATTTSSPSAESSAKPATPPNRSPDKNDSRTVAQRLEDASVATRVKQSLIRPRSLRRFDFSPTVVRGHLILRGDVNTREQYRQTQHIASNTEGVRSVANQVTVQGQSVSPGNAPAAAPEERNATYYTIQRGDTLWQIAQKYEVSVAHLRTLNDDLSGALQPGKQIRVR